MSGPELDKASPINAQRLLRDPAPHEELAAKAHDHVRSGDVRMGYFKMCEAYSERREAALDLLEALEVAQRVLLWAERRMASPAYAEVIANDTRVLSAVITKARADHD